MISKVYSIVDNPKATRVARKKARRSAVQQHFQRELIERATPAEIAFQHILVDLRIQFMFQHIFGKKSRKFYIVDFYLPQLKIVVEIDGPYHSNPVQGWRDEMRTKKLQKRYGDKVSRVIRFSNDDVLTTPYVITQKLLKVLKSLEYMI